MRAMSFITENGVILDNFGNIIFEVPGTPSQVNFPHQTILKLHTLQPGYINRLVHTHPLGMTDLSSLDKAMMRRWAVTMHPFPIRLSTLTSILYGGVEVFQETIYTATLEPRETWEERKSIETNPDYRDIEIIRHSADFYRTTMDMPEWMERLVEKSYVLS